MTKAAALREELYKYGIISAYLFVCFSVVMMYSASVEGESGAGQPSFSMALVKALVMGKFILVGDALSVGARADSHPLAHRIAWKSLAMLSLLIVFKVLEEIIVGWFHGESIAQVVDEFARKTAIQMVAPTLMMLLVLVPLIGATELYRSMDTLRAQQQ